MILVAALISMTAFAAEVSVSGFATVAGLSASAGSSPDCQRIGDPYPVTTVWDDRRGMTWRKMSRVLWSWNSASSAASVDRALSLVRYVCSAEPKASGTEAMGTHAAKTELM